MTGMTGTTGTTGSGGLLATRRRRVALVVLAQVAILVVAVSGQLSARVLGQDYRLRVAAYDPIDPFRGAYVELSYPELFPPDVVTDGSSGQVYVTLVTQDGISRAGTRGSSRPASGPYLRCERDVRPRCGIEHLFLPQDQALSLQLALQNSSAVATIRVDSRGHAALVSVDPPR